MLELPHKGDVIEIGFPGEQIVKSFEVEYLVHKMIQLPPHEIVDGVLSTNNPPWRWEFRLHGILYDPDVKELCVCAQGVTKCPRHGDQPAEREMCPRCGKAVLGYCAQGEYCTSDGCGYAA
jgi:hypothetical protein